MIANCTFALKQTQSGKLDRELVHREWPIEGVSSTRFRSSTSNQSEISNFPNARRRIRQLTVRGQVIDNRKNHGCAPQVLICRHLGSATIENETQGNSRLSF